MLTVPDPVLAAAAALRWSHEKPSNVVREERAPRLNASGAVVYLYELISLANSLFQLFLLVLQDRTRVFLPLQFLKRQEQNIKAIR